MTLHQLKSATLRHRAVRRRSRVGVVVTSIALAAACSFASSSLPAAAGTSGPRAALRTIEPAALEAAAQHDVDGPVDVGGGRQIYAKCQGRGSPTVVLIAGKGNGAKDWQEVLDPADPAHDTPGDDVGAGMGALVPSDDAVFPSVARSTRVCTYDRPDIRVGAADSTTPRAQPHTADKDVADLHALLGALGERGPYVLVSHSYGGVIANLYARTYPKSIGGLVMVDTVAPQMKSVVKRAALVDWDATNATTSPQVREGVQLIKAFKRIAAAGPLPKVPAVVLSADKPWRVDLLPAEARQGDKVTFADWLEALNRLSAELDAEHVTATNSGHDVYLYSPKLVVDAIREVVDDARSGAS